jgi:hypothetical protein
MREADRIQDAGLQHSFLARISQHREIVALWMRSQERRPTTGA